MVWYGKQRQPKGTQHAQAISKEDKIKLEPSVATGCVDGSTPMVWYGRGMHCWFLIIIYSVLYAPLKKKKIHRCGPGMAFFNFLIDHLSRAKPGGAYI